MKKYPSIYKLKYLYELCQNHLRMGVSVNVDGKWVPARSMGYPSIKTRFQCAWLVFTGKADAVIWPEDEQEPTP